MPKKIGTATVSRNTLLNAPLPPATKTYTVISHSYAINTILQALSQNQFTVKEEIYRCAQDAKVAHGTFVINFQDDPDLVMVYSFSNSYDKTMRFRAAIGAQVQTNGAFMVCQMDSWKRKHTGTADDETEELINHHISNAQKYFDLLKEAKEKMKSITITKGEFGNILGELFINEYLTIDQVSLIAKEYNNPSFKYETANDNLWTCYNHIIHGLKQTHPSKWMQNQIATHLYFTSKFNLATFDEEEQEQPAAEPAVDDDNQLEIPGIKAQVEPVVILPGYGAPEEIPVTPAPVEEQPDPAQIDLEDSIREIEMEQKSVTEQVSEAAQEATVNYKETLEKLDDAPVVTTNTDPTANPDVQYFPAPDFPGLGIDEVFEDGDVYFQVLRFETVEGVDYMVCKPWIPDNPEGATPLDQTDSIESLEDAEAAVLPSAEIPVKEEPPAAEEEIPDVLETTEPETTSTLPEDLEPPVDLVKVIMTKELEELYGYKPEFTYVLLNNQYNIKLSTGETITFTRPYIDGQLGK